MNPPYAHDIAELIDSLEDSSMEERVLAGRRLLDLGSVIVPPLLHTMETQTGSRTVEAARLLLEFDTPEVFDAMCRALSGANVLVGQIATAYLERFGKRSLAPLLEALPTARYMVQVAAVVTLEHIGDPQAVEPLMAHLAATDESSGLLRCTLIQALGVLGDTRAADLIRQYADDPDHHVRQRVQVALQRLGMPGTP